MIEYKFLLVLWSAFLLPEWPDGFPAYVFVELDDCMAVGDLATMSLEDQFPGAEVQFGCLPIEGETK